MYKLTEGACPKSYGPNVARLAGLPTALVTRASHLSSLLEACAADKSISLAAALAAELKGVNSLGAQELGKLRSACKVLEGNGAAQNGEEGLVEELGQVLAEAAV